MLYASFVFRQINLQTKFVKLFLIDARRSIKHDVASAVVLRECNTVAYTVKSGKDTYPSVKTVSKTSMRRSTVLEGVHQEAELLLSSLWSESENLEHLLLKLRIVYTY